MKLPHIKTLSEAKASIARLAPEDVANQVHDQDSSITYFGDFGDERFITNQTNWDAAIEAAANYDGKAWLEPIVMYDVVFKERPYRWAYLYLREGNGQLKPYHYGLCDQS